MSPFVTSHSRTRSSDLNSVQQNILDNSDEWKSLWPISSVHSPPLLLSPTINKLGPLIFNPSPEHHHVITSPSISSQIPPYPNLSLSRFIRKSASSIFPSTAISIGSQLSSVLSNPQQLLAHNFLQLLRCPGTDSTLAFFPTGSNSDQVGFMTLSVENSQLTVSGGYGETEGLTYRIVEISVSPLADCEFTLGSSCDSIIGYLLVSTTISVHYYMIRIRTEPSGKITPRLQLIINKSFKSSIVVHACWSPHIPEESLVLLENGDLFLFDLDSFSSSPTPSLRLTGKKVKVSWEKYVGLDKGGWLSCDFSWHPRTLIAVHSNAVFLIDLRSENYDTTPLLKTDTGHTTTNDRFLAFSIAGPDRFFLTLASTVMVFLCDIRKPMMPILRWAHNLANPSYIFVSSLSKLRSLFVDDTYKRVSEEGYGILLGSFWNCEFSLFCYGPQLDSSSSSSSSSSSFYSWGLPSDIPLVTRECCCGSCLVKQEFYKDQLPVWINWQEKKDFVLGFGILDEEISSQLFRPDGFGGFTVITLTFSGNLELHRYCASWDYSENAHIVEAFDPEDSFYYDMGEDEYKFRKVYLYMRLDWLNGYLNSDLNRILSKKLYRNNDNETPGKASLGSVFHENICRNLNTYRSDGSLNITDIIKDINLPTSIHEIALRSVWSNLPKNILCLGFSTYLDLPNLAAKFNKNVPLEFPDVPCQQPHLPPFFFRAPLSRSSKWSKKHKPSEHLVGPIMPIPFLMTYHKSLMLKADNRPANLEIDLECDKVMRVANELESQSCSDQAVSLDDDGDDLEDVFHVSQNSRHFSSYKPVAKMDYSGPEDKKHMNLIFRVGQKDVKEFFDSDCCCTLKFNFKEESTNFGQKEMKSYEQLKRQYSKFKQGFHSYQDYITKSNIPKS